MPYYNKDPKGDHNFDNHPYGVYKEDIAKIIFYLLRDGCRLLSDPWEKRYILLGPTGNILRAQKRNSLPLNSLDQEWSTWMLRGLSK